jgi:4-hydroxy-tetrahydrodipicolinate reductase
MKIALLGKGKTGGKVLELHQDVIVFDTKNSPTLEKLQSCDVIISFLPGHVFLELIPLLIESKLPVVTGSTGFDWPKDIHVTLTENNIKWIKGHNFSLGMALIYNMINALSSADKLFPQVKYKIHEVHHTKKLDAPSGTAISWEEWLKQTIKIPITSDRVGDVVGDHCIEMQTGYEKITLRHEALDRKIFAEGSLWAAKQLLSNDVPIGLNLFENLTRNITKPEGNK